MVHTVPFFAMEAKCITSGLGWMKPGSPEFLGILLVLYSSSLLFICKQHSLRGLEGGNGYE